MMKLTALKKATAIAMVTTALIVAIGKQPLNAEQRKSVAHPNTSYQLSFYNRHRPSYRVAGALHFAHSRLHDV